MAQQSTIDLDRACQMVGLFLHHWALVEAKLNTAITAAVELDGLQAAIVCSNVQLRDKIHVLKTCTSFLPITEDEIKRLKGTLERIRDFAAAYRNMVAHDMFSPSEAGDVVEFRQIKAKGTLSFPIVRWEDRDFTERSLEMLAFMRQLDTLINHFEQLTIDRHIAKALDEPKQVNQLLALLDRQMPQTQEPPDSDPSNPETDPGSSP